MVDMKDFYKPKKNEDNFNGPEKEKIARDTFWSRFKNNIMSKKVIITSVLLLVATAVTVFYFYPKKKANLPEKQAEVKTEDQIIVEKIGEFMELPDEKPAIASITDMEKMKNQEFFAKAENGDKVLIYLQSKKVILYRPSLNKIIEYNSSGSKAGNEEKNGGSQSVAGESDSKNEVAGEETQKETLIKDNFKVSVYNGTDIRGLAKTVAEKLSEVDKIEIVEKNNAKKLYDKIIVIDLTGNNEEMIQKIIEILGGETGELPEGEIKPEADILVIAGKE
jgi:hypothetical protein